MPLNAEKYIQNVKKISKLNRDIFYKSGWKKCLHNLNSSVLLCRTFALFYSRDKVSVKDKLILHQIQG